MFTNIFAVFLQITENKNDGRRRFIIYIMYDSTAGGCLSGFDVSSRGGGVAPSLAVVLVPGSCHRWRLSGSAAGGGGCLHWLTMAGRSCSLDVSSRAAGVIVGGRALDGWRGGRSIVGGSWFLSSLAAVRISSRGGGCLHWLTMAGRSCSRQPDRQQGAPARPPVRIVPRCTGRGQA